MQQLRTAVGVWMQWCITHSHPRWRSSGARTIPHSSQQRQRMHQVIDPLNSRYVYKCDVMTTSTATKIKTPRAPTTTTTLVSRTTTFISRYNNSNKHQTHINNKQQHASTTTNKQTATTPATNHTHQQQSTSTTTATSVSTTYNSKQQRTAHINN